MAAAILGTFFRHHDVSRSMLGQQLDQKVVGHLITSITQGPRVEIAARSIAKLNQGVSGQFGQFRR